MTEANEVRWLRFWLQDSGALLISQGALTGIATLVMVLVARTLSTYQFGLFSSFLGTAQAVSFVVDAGLSLWLVRECARIRAGSDSPQGQDVAISQCLSHSISTVLYTGVAAVGISLVVALALGLSIELAGAQSLFMAYVALLAGSVGLEAKLRAERDIRPVMEAILLEKLLLLTLVGVALFFELGLLPLGLAYVTAGTARVCVDFRRSFLTLQQPYSLASPKRVVSIIRSTAPFALNSGALMFLPRLDIAVVAVISVVSASYYALGLQIVTTAQLIPATASIALLPFVSTRVDANTPMLRVVLSMSGIGLAVAVVGALLAPILVPAVFGSQYSPAIGTIQLMIAAIPAIFACNTVIPFLYGGAHERTAVAWTVIPSLAGTIFVLVGQLTFGSPGAAVGFIGRYLTITICFAILARQKLTGSQTNQSASATDDFRPTAPLQ